MEIITLYCSGGKEESVSKSDGIININRKNNK